jgi:hypothetical protein
MTLGAFAAISKKRAEWVARMRVRDGPSINRTLSVLLLEN